MRATEKDIEADTRQRLLDVAGEVFAERGFDRTTIREICRRAKANVAAVNYHFGDKRKLYEAAFDYSLTCADEQSNPISGSNEPPEDRLRQFTRRFLRRLLDPGRPSWHGRLLAREMSEPTGALEALVQREIRPRYEVLQGIVSELAGDVPPRVIAKCAASVIGQMMHYHFARPVLKLVSPVYGDLEKHVEELADHVTRFSLAGILAIAARYRK
ncbi:MAG TPA: CerR family C-terminal domain-containing protein [Tepidisphaeraceae bacterium]|jgi:AcrR family transcriptional regulator